MQVVICCYLWDLLDEGCESVLDRLAGELGAAGVCVAATCPSMEQLRPHPDLPSRWYRHEAAAYFQPDKSKYGNTRIRPLVAAWLGSRNPLRALADACGHAGLTLQAWAVCCHGSALAARYPFAAGKTVFGDVLVHGLCPSNPDVREYVRALVDDLSSHYGLEAVVLDAACYPGQHSHAHPQRGIEPGPVEALLTGLCFCESCRQEAVQAGLDIDATVRTARVTLERWMAGGQPAPLSLEALAAKDRLLEAYLQMRCRLVARWVSRLRAAGSTNLLYHVPPEPFAAGVEVRAVAEHVDACLFDLDDGPARTAREDLERWAELAGGMNRLAVRVRAYPPACPDAPSLVRTLTNLAELGVARAYIENYGLIPLERLAWLRQAIRAVQRVHG